MDKIIGPKKYSLRCLINGDRVTFTVRANPTEGIESLKGLIHGSAIKGILRGTDSKDLVLSKVDIDPCHKDRQLLAQRSAEMLNEWTKVSDAWLTPPPNDRIQIFVKHPAITSFPNDKLVTIAVIELDDEVLAPFSIKVRAAAILPELQQHICRALEQCGLISNSFSSPLAILPLQAILTLDDVIRNLADLRTEVQQQPNDFESRLSDIFPEQPDHRGRIHFVVWLPPHNQRFPPSTHFAISWLTTITMRNILNFENVACVSQSLYGRQSNFKNLVLREYGQFDQNNLFDMATGKTFPDEQVVVTHIFPYRWQKFLLQFTSLNDIDDVSNGLMLYQPVAWAFDLAKLCIQVDDAGRMLFHLFDEELRDVCLASKARSLQAVAAKDDEVFWIKEMEFGATFGDLHGLPVRFPVGPTVRPSKRLLALHAYAACLQAQSLNRVHDIELPFPQYNFLDNETTGESLHFFVDLWRKGVDIGLPPDSNSNTASQGLEFPEHAFEL